MTSEEIQNSSSALSLIFSSPSPSLVVAAVFDIFADATQQVMKLPTPTYIYIFPPPAPLEIFPSVNHRVSRQLCIYLWIFIEGGGVAAWLRGQFQSNKPVTSVCMRYLPGRGVTLCDYFTYYPPPHPLLRLSPSLCFF